MNKIVSILCLLTILCSCNKTKETSEPDRRRDRDDFEYMQEQKRRANKITINYLISGKSAGDFTIGNPIPATSVLYDVRKETRQETAEGETYEVTHYIVSYKGEDLVQLTPDNTNNIGEINVLSGRFKTVKGIGISTSLNDAIQLYPEHKLWYTYVSESYVFETPAVQVQFLLNADDFTGSIEITSDMVMLKHSDFKPEAKVAGIRII